MNVIIYKIVHAGLNSICKFILTKKAKTMNALHLPIIAAALLSLYACNPRSENPPPSPPAEDTVTRYEPVESNPPETDYEPAFEGQTRTYGIKTYTELEVQTISTALTKPWGIIVLPDGRLLITQKDGNMVLCSSSGMIEKTISGLPPVNNLGQGGLLDVVADPDFSTNRMIYWTFSENYMDGTVTSVAKGKISPSETSVEDVEIIFRAIPAYDGALHYGSRIIFDRSGYLLVSTGERSDLATRPQAQELNSGLGKIMRITTNGEPAASNPFVGSSTTMPEIYSYGHRNPQGMALDPATNTLYVTEHGPRGGDEINVIQAGANYGWPIITYGIEYSGAVIGGGLTQQEGMEQPLYYWDPIIAPAGTIFYDKAYIPEWQGSLLIGALAGSHIARVRILDGKVAGEERLLEGMGERFRDLALDEMGIVYVVTDSGKLIKISKK